MRAGLEHFIRDNLNAFSFNMLVIFMFDVLTFLVLFILVLPLPEMFRQGYANYVSKCTVGYLFFMMFCMYNMLSTLFKLTRNINDYHSAAGELKRVEPRAFYKRVAKNQRDVLLCVVGCAFSLLTLFLSLQLKTPTPEVAEEKKTIPVEDKKEKS